MKDIIKKDLNSLEKIKKILRSTQSIEVAKQIEIIDLLNLQTKKLLELQKNFIN
jgi:hypothetical protein